VSARARLPVATGHDGPARSSGGAVNRFSLALSSVTGGLSSALVPVLAVFLLPVTDYGAFALVFLVFAEGWSVLLSAVCDTWARRRAAGGTAGTWGDYSGAIAAVSGLAALVTAGVGWWVYDSVLLGAAMAVGAGASLYRQGARYHHAIVHGPRSVLPSDIAAVGVLAAALIGLLVSGRPMLPSLLVAWAISSLAGAAFFLRGGALRGGGPVRWYRRNDRTVRVLLGESLLMDAGATGTPVLVAPILGLYQFGIYRSVSSLSVPLQLLIDPIRPNLSQISPRQLARPPVVAALVATATVLGLAGYLVLTHVVPAVLSFSPVLMALSGFALPCSLFLGFQFLTYVLNIFARMNVSHRRLLGGRAVHTVFAIALPVLGAVLGSVTGAIWGFVAATALTVVIWSALLASSAREGRATAVGPPTPRDIVGS
jgi:hypothetical protein